MKKIVSAILLITMLLTALLPVTATAEDGADESGFIDVVPGKWYCKAIGYCVSRGIMAGTSATTFEPNAPLTRAMFVTMLAAYDGADTKELKQTSPFDDVPAGKWYTGGVAWAAREGIVAGTGAGKFSPNAVITREQLAAMLRAYAEYKGLYTRYIESDFENFGDIGSVAKWAKTGARWAVGYGLISGMGEVEGKPSFAPKGTATRAQAAVMMMKLDLGAEAEKTFTIAGNDISLYRVVISKDAVKNGDLEFLLDTAEAFIRFVKDAYGVELPLVRDSEEPTDFEIVIGRTTREDAGLVTVEVEDEFDIGYTVNIQGSRLVIAGDVDGDMRRGSQYGMYDFLEDALGYHMYNDDCIVRDDVSVALPAGYVLTGEPGIKDRVVYLTRGWDDVLYNDEYYTCASLTHELPRWIDPSLDYRSATPCLSSEENIQKVITYIRNKITKKYHDTIYLCCGDNETGYCKCADCVAAYREDGTTAATLVRLANRVCEALRDDFPDFKVKLMAYLYTAAPPKVTKLDDHIIVYYCPIHACVSHTFDDPDCQINKKIRQEAEGWSKLASEFYVWDYSVNFDYLCCPLPNFSVLLDNVRYMYGLGVRGYFNNGVSANIGEFTELRSYLLTRIYRDPQMTDEQYEKHMNGFLAAWYGPGWRNVREFIDLMDEYSESKNFKCGARPSVMFELDKIAARSNYILSLWKDAAEKAETDAQREHVLRSSVSMYFILQCALYDPMVTNGTDAQKQGYYDANQALYDLIKYTGVRWNEDVKETPFNIYVSPENW